MNFGIWSCDRYMDWESIPSNICCKSLCFRFFYCTKDIWTGDPTNEWEYTSYFHDFGNGPGNKRMDPESRLWRIRPDHQLLVFLLALKDILELDTSQISLLVHLFQRFWEWTRQQTYGPRSQLRRIRPIISCWFSIVLKDILELDLLQMTFLAHIIPRMFGNGTRQQTFGHGKQT